jgi:ubiquinone/menaquinone biosynthesis C-methylase UbiE
MAKAPTQGWQGWDEYAEFYDWENQRTLGRRDVRFWQDLARRQAGAVLELGCGTGRVTVPVARTGARVVGVDRSSEMLVRARRRATRAKLLDEVRLVRGDIRRLPFRSPAKFRLVMAPYGVLQSLIRESDLASSLDAVARVLEPGGLFGIDLVPDVPRWKEYRNRVTIREHTARGLVTLTESVSQDSKRRLTTFDQRFVETSPKGPPVERRFSLTFRTLTLPQMVRRVERRGFAVEAVLGDYAGGPWDRRADVWILLARRLS